MTNQKKQLEKLGKEIKDVGVRIAETYTSALLLQIAVLKLQIKQMKEKQTADKSNTLKSG